jgi:hypothetical protein
MELIVLKHERRLSQIEALNDMPLYPTEQVLWDETIVPHENYSDGCLALPKLNVQFLTMHDYLLRNLNLFRLESTYDIRTDMEDVIPRMKAFRNASGDTQFAGCVHPSALSAADVDVSVEMFLSSVHMFLMLWLIPPRALCTTPFLTICSATFFRLSCC